MFVLCESNKRIPLCSPKVPFFLSFFLSFSGLSITFYSYTRIVLVPQYILVGSLGRVRYGCHPIHKADNAGPKVSLANQPKQRVHISILYKYQYLIVNGTLCIGNTN